MPLIIGLYGEFESGKDTVAEILCRRFEYTRLAVGEYIRKEMSYGSIPPGVWCPDRIRSTILSMREKRMKEALYAKPTTPEIRAALQWYGETRFRMQSNYWLQQLAMDVEKLKVQGKDRIVVSDVRRVNEFDYCSRQGEMWRVIRCTALTGMLLHERKEVKYGHLRDHITETCLNNHSFKQYISNNGDLQDLERLVCLLVKEYSLA